MTEPGAGASPLILVADDVPANVELLFDQLNTLGYRTISADDGPSALAACFVRFREEPVLRRRFGADYDEYRATVSAWWPRLHPWQQGGR